MLVNVFPRFFHFIPKSTPNKNACFGIEKGEKERGERRAEGGKEGKAASLSPNGKKTGCGKANAT
ncbi:MAG TPA: hypothetical protein H9674_08825 [Firmicutes bacterium]|nr:hypothetical protein [Bacillota bacterium]